MQGCPTILCNRRKSVPFSMTTAWWCQKQFSRWTAAAATALNLKSLSASTGYKRSNLHFETHSSFLTWQSLRQELDKAILFQLSFGSFSDSPQHEEHRRLICSWNTVTNRILTLLKHSPPSSPLLSFSSPVQVNGICLSLTVFFLCSVQGVWMCQQLA